jgi:hypothetical protein
MLYRPLFIFLLSAAPPCVQAQASYPVIGKLEQSGRDEDRRTILEAEMADEREAFAKAKDAFQADASEDHNAAVRRHMENIAALQRELDRGANRPSPRSTPRIVVEAIRPASASGAPRFWDPYNRESDTADLSTNHRKESHE